MPNPSKPHTARLDADHPRLVRLPASFIPGDRVVVTTDVGDQYAALAVTCDGEGPLVMLPVPPSGGATRAYVRRAPERQAA